MNVAGAPSRALPAPLCFHLRELLGTDQPEARRGDDLDAIVLFVRRSGDQRVQRRVEAEAAMILRCIVNLAVGDENRARHAALWNVGHGGVEGAEKVGRFPARLVRAGCVDPAHFQIGDFRELVLQFGLDLARALVAPGKLHAGACVGDNDGNIGKRFPILVFQIRVGQRQKQAAKAQGPQDNAPAVPPSRERDRRHAKTAQAASSSGEKKGKNSTDQFMRRVLLCVCD